MQMKSVNPCHLKSEGHFHPRGRQYSAKTQAKDKHTSSLDQEFFYFLLTETRNKHINLMLHITVTNYIAKHIGYLITR